MTETAGVESESVLSEAKTEYLVNESDYDYPSEDGLSYSDRAERIRLEVLKRYIKSEVAKEKRVQKQKKVRIEDGIEEKPSSVRWQDQDEVVCDDDDDDDEDECEEDDKREESEEEEVIETPPPTPRKKQKNMPPPPPKRVVKKRSISTNVAISGNQGKKLVFV